MEEGIADVTIKDMYQDGIVRLSRDDYTAERHESGPWAQHDA